MKMRDPHINEKVFAGIMGYLLRTGTLCVAGRHRCRDLSTAERCLASRCCIDTRVLPWRLRLRCSPRFAPATCPSADWPLKILAWYWKNLWAATWPVPEQINLEVGWVFKESQIFRIDHYLGKEAVQNLLALRFGNVLFEPLWRREWISDVQITIAEEIGVGNRMGYYETSGALRDMLQNHLLQLLCIVAVNHRYRSRRTQCATRN